jgi:hypothetical protein
MISIITVNFNNAEATEKLLRSLERQTDTAFDVFVVDNASATEDRAQLGAHATTSPLALDILHSTTNRGFSGGNNLAIRKALEQGSKWLVFLNNDTEVPEDFIAELRRELSDIPTAVVGIPLQEGSATAYAGIIRWFHWTFPHLYTRTTHHAPRTTLLYAIGAAMAVHRDVFERIGLMDERYFLYFEDAEFSLRARQVDIPVRFLSHPVVSHGVSVSTLRLGSPLLLRYHARNALLLNATHGPFFVRLSLHFWAFFAIVKQLLKLVMMPARRTQSRAIASGILDFYAQKFGKIDGHRH